MFKELAERGELVKISSELVKKDMKDSRFNANDFARKVKLT